MLAVIPYLLNTPSTAFACVTLGLSLIHILPGRTSYLIILLLSLSVCWVASGCMNKSEALYKGPVSLFIHSSLEISSHNWYFVLIWLSMIFWGVEIIRSFAEISSVEYGFSAIIEFSIWLIISFCLFEKSFPNIFSKSCSCFIKKLNLFNSIGFIFCNCASSK